MKLHIIIVNYNAGVWLQRSVLSALQNSDAVITVVDNASSDQSVDLAKKVTDSTRVHWIENTQNVGFAAANNQVLRPAIHDSQGTEFFVLMNPDCELKPSTLDSILKNFAQHQKLGLASCMIRNEDGTVQATSRRRYPTPLSSLWRISGLGFLFPSVMSINLGDEGLVEGLEEVEAVSGAFMVVRTEALREVGPLDEDYFMHCEDLDWCKRFQHKGWIVGFDSEAEVVHAKGISSKGRPIAVLWTMHKGMHRFFSKFYRDSSNLLLYYLVIAGIYLSLVPRVFAVKIKSLLGRNR